MFRIITTKEYNRLKEKEQEAKHWYNYAGCLLAKINGTEYHPD